MKKEIIELLEKAIREIEEMPEDYKRMRELPYKLSYAMHDRLNKCKECR